MESDEGYPAWPLSRAAPVRMLAGMSRGRGRRVHEWPGANQRAGTRIAKGIYALPRVLRPFMAEVAAGVEKRGVSNGAENLEHRTSAD